MDSKYLSCRYLLDELRRIRVSKGLTLQDVSLDLSTSACYVSRVERAQVVPSLEFFVRYMEYLDKNLCDFIDVLPF